MMRAKGTINNGCIRCNQRKLKIKKTHIVMTVFLTQISVS